jgi:hypothetical protein
MVVMAADGTGFKPAVGRRLGKLRVMSSRISTVSSRSAHSITPILRRRSETVAPTSPV